MTGALPYVHTVTVKTLTPASSYTDGFAAPVTVACWCQEWADLNQFTTEGGNVNASATVYAGLADLAKFTSGSLVTLPSGRESYVVTVKVYDSGALRLPLDHIEVLVG